MRNVKLDNRNISEINVTLRSAIAIDDYDTKIKIVIGSAIFISATIGFVCGYKASNAVHEKMQNSILSYLKSEQKELT